jgi:hypothetical protein
MNLFELGVTNAGDNYFSSFEAMHQIGSVEPVDIVPHRQDKIASQVLDAIYGAGVRRPAH